MSRDTLGVVAASLFIGVAGLGLAPEEALAESQVDLAVMQAVVSPPAVYPGQRFAVGVRVKNYGPAATTKACNVLVRLSQTYPDPAYPGSPYTLTESSEFSVNVPPLGSLREWEWSSVGSWTPKTTPVRAGARNSISITVDSSNVVPESNETNNRVWTSYRLLGRDWYVTPAGSDVTGDGSQARPFATSMRAGASAQPGDHFYIPSNTASTAANMSAGYDIPPLPPNPYSQYASICYQCPQQDPPEPLTLWYGIVPFPSTSAYNSFLASGGDTYQWPVWLGDRPDNTDTPEARVAKYVTGYQLTGKVKITLFKQKLAEWFKGAPLTSEEMGKTQMDAEIFGVSLTMTR